MKTSFRLLLTIITFLALAEIAVGQQRLLVIGGGERPPEAIMKFVEWSGGPKARILIVTWASGVPDESFVALKKSFEAHSGTSVEHAAMRPLDAQKRTRFIEQLKNASAVFFSGGDQNRVMDVLADAELLELLRKKYKLGTPFGGTSAGAAVMSDPMMTGEADLKILDGTKVGVRKGLGLIANVMFDQHFLVRQRHNRLFGFVIQNPAFLGIGIDEDNAVLISDNRNLEVTGSTHVMFVDAKDQNGALRVNFLKPGERFDLKKRKRQGRVSAKVTSKQSVS